LAPLAALTITGGEWRWRVGLPVDPWLDGQLTVLQSVLVDPARPNHPSFSNACLLSLGMR
jgi:hypothetical protein